MMILIRIIDPDRIIRINPYTPKTPRDLPPIF